ncbi:MAG: hypothetical protein KGM96_10380 [Acidobacteriota bacterium]|nr:hypothetical protein [Acidobacteriota bacterium]
MSTTPLSRSEFAALGTIARARQENLKNMFDGTRLTFAKYAREKAIKNSLSDAKSLASSTKKLVKGVQTGSKTASALSQAGDIHSNGVEFLKIATNLHDFSDVADAVGSEVAHSLISEMTPFIGVLTSSFKAAKSWRAVVKNAVDLYKADYYLEGVLPGDPTAAAEAVVQTIKRFLAANTADAVRNTASASTKIAGLFADLGTATTAAIGAASALAKLIQELAILGRDYTEMKAGNDLLKNPAQLNMNVFRVCPILGCYLIACSDSSMVLNFFVADIGLPGWMTKIETMKKNQLDPLIKNANKAIVSSHLTLEGLKANKGALASKGILDRFKENAKNHFNQLIKSNASRAASA